MPTSARWPASRRPPPTSRLRDQWEAAKKQLDELENRMTEFRWKNAAGCPRNWLPICRRSARWRRSWPGVNDAMNRIGQSKLMLEGQIRIYREQIDTALPRAPRP